MSRQTLNRLLTHHCVFGFSSWKSLLLRPTWCNPVSQSILTALWISLRILCVPTLSVWLWVWLCVFFLFVLIRRVVFFFFVLFFQDWLITPAKWRLQCDTLGCRESVLSINLRCGFYSFSGWSESIGKPPVCLILVAFASKQTSFYSNSDNSIR